MGNVFDLPHEGLDLLTPEERAVRGLHFHVVAHALHQEGVQLGKVLAKKVLAKETDGALTEYSKLLGIF